MPSLEKPSKTEAQQLSTVIVMTIIAAKINELKYF